MHVLAKEVTKKDLRNFGLIMGGMIALFFGLLIPWIWNAAWPTWPWIVTAVFVVLGLAIPDSLSPVYKIWMKVGHALGWFNTRLLLSLVFYLMIFPIGLVFKLLGKDPMARRLDQQQASYRIKSKQPSRNNLEKPF